MRLEQYDEIDESLAVMANLSTMDRIAAVLGLDDVFVKRGEDEC